MKRSTKICVQCSTFVTSNTTKCPTCGGETFGLIYDVGEHISEIASNVHKLAKDNGWHDVTETEDHFIERTCNNLHDEISELHEAWRNGELRKPCDKAKKMNDEGIHSLSCLEEELADILIRFLDASEKLGIDIQHAIEVKHEFNKTRPFRHGNKLS